MKINYSILIVLLLLALIVGIMARLSFNPSRDVDIKTELRTPINNPISSGELTVYVEQKDGAQIEQKEVK